MDVDSYQDVIESPATPKPFSQLVKREDYQEPEVKKNKPKIPCCVLPTSMMDIDEMIKTIIQAGYLVKKELKDGADDRTILFS